MKPIIIFAPNVGGGGGLILLRAMLQAAWPGGQITAILDRRGQPQIGSLPRDIEIHWVNSSIGGRWRAETLLSRLATHGAAVLCFHNLPPVLPVRSPVYCYVQNANLVGLIPPANLGPWVRLRSAIERLIARCFRHRVHRYFVQTPSMAAALRDWYGPAAPPIDVLPFTAADSDDDASSTARQRADEAVPASWDFIYVSDGSAHKNHGRLFAAWRLLADQGILPSLAVTLHPERDAALHEQVRQMAADGLRVRDLGQIAHADVRALYKTARALIFPSYAESMGMPLLEAQAAGLPIVAPELDYVRDVCDPHTTFDHRSPRSIARAVQRFLGMATDRVQPLSPERFVTAVCGLIERESAAGIPDGDRAVARASSRQTDIQ